MLVNNSNRELPHIEKFKVLPSLLGTLLILVCVIFLWVISVQIADPKQLNDFGLVSILPYPIYISLLLLTVSFCLTIHKSDTPEIIPLLYVITLIVILHLTPVLIYDTLRYSWAWKHVGIVDYILRNQSINTDISVLSAYHNWPGFFALNTFIVEVADIRNLIGFAEFSPVFFNLLFLCVLVAIFKTLTTDSRLIWLSVWFFFLFNWVGQDYYSPQALIFFLHLTILAICLRWFNVEGSYSEHGSLKVLILFLYAIIVSSHPLTPFMTLVSISALVIFRQCNVKLLPFLMLIMVALWITFGARNFFLNEIKSLIESFGALVGNLDKNLIDYSKVSSGQKVVILMGRTLSILLWLMAVFGSIKRFRMGYLDKACILLLAAPFTVLVATAYGGEILFRVYLFSLPFAAFFAASLIYTDSETASSLRSAIVSILLSVIFLTCFGFAHYGKDRQYYFNRNEVDVAQYLYNTALPNSLLIEGSRNYPTQFHNYEYFTYVPIDRESRNSRLKIINNPTDTLKRWMSNDKYTKSYLIITRSQKAMVDALGLMPKGSLEKVEQALLESPDFTMLYGNSDAKIFVLADVLTGGLQ